MDLRISFQNIGHSDAMELAVREKTEKLQSRFQRIHSCAAVIGLDNAHGEKLFFVRLDLTIPGKEIAVSSVKHPDANLALRDAFEAAGKRLESEIEKTREARRRQ